MNPTVSVNKTFFFEIFTTRVVVERVVNKPVSTEAVSSARALKSKLLPALVYPAKETEENPSSSLRARCKRRFFRIFFSFSYM